MGSKSKIQFEDFCQQTSIHGWSFLLFKGYGIFQILFWITIIAGSFVSCMYMISLNLQEFKQATVEFETISLTENLDDIFFPSIFVINANQQRKSYLMAMIQENNLTEVLDVENLIQFYFDSSLGIPLDPKIELLWKGMLQSPVTSQLFDYFVEQNQDKHPKQYSSKKLYHNHRNFHKVQAIWIRSLHMRKIRALPRRRLSPRSNSDKFTGRTLLNIQIQAVD